MSDTQTYHTLNGLSGSYIELCDLFDRYDLNQFQEVYLKNMNEQTKAAFKPYFRRRMMEKVGITNRKFIASGIPTQGASKGFELDMSIRDAKCMVTDEFTRCFAVQFANTDDEDVFITVSLKWINDNSSEIDRGNNKFPVKP